MTKEQILNRATSVDNFTGRIIWDNNNFKVKKAKITLNNTKVHRDKHGVVIEYAEIENEKLTGVYISGFAVLKKCTLEQSRVYDGYATGCVFTGGLWENGIFDGGTMSNSRWCDGSWINSDWLGGVDVNYNEHDEGDSPDLWGDSLEREIIKTINREGTYKNFKGKVFWAGIDCEVDGVDVNLYITSRNVQADFKNGTITSGKVTKSKLYNVDFLGETIERSYWNGGDFNGKSFKNGYWASGNWLSGLFDDKSIWVTGTFKDGTFSGQWIDGVWDGGKWKNGKNPIGRVVDEDPNFW